MKILKWLGISSGLLLGVILFLTLTATGNNLILPWINNYLQASVKEAKIEVTHLRIHSGDIQLNAKVNDAIHLKSFGLFDIWTQKFNLAYTLNADKIQTPSIQINEKIEIKGTAKGTLDDMQIQGKGKAFKSNISYALQLLENEPKQIRLNIKDASIPDILAVASLPHYATGKLNISIDMAELHPDNPQGKAHIEIKEGILNQKLLQKDFNITLPKQTHYSANLHAKTKDTNIFVKGKVLSDLANLEIKEATFYPKTQNLHATYHLDIAKLSGLKSLSPIPMRGSLKVAGTLSSSQGKVKATGQSKSFGGLIDFNYTGEKIHATLKNVKNILIAYKLKQAKYLAGTTNVTLNITDIKKMQGTFDIRIKAPIQTKLVRKKLDLNLGKNFTLNLHSKGTLSTQKVIAKTTINTTMATLQLPKSIYDLKQSTFSSAYHIDVPNLAKLKPLTGAAYQGDMQIDGQIKQAKSLIITGKAKEFDGKMDFKLINNSLTAQVQGATISKIMHMLDYPQVIDGVSRADVAYNLTTKKGKVTATLDNTKILPSQLTVLLQQFAKINLGKERFNNVNFLANLSAKKIGFSLDAKSHNSYIKLLKGTLSKKSGKLSGTLDIRIRGKKFQALLAGTVDNPRIKLDTQSLVKDKVKEELNKLIDKKLKLPKGEVGDALKGMLNGFF